MRKILSLVLVLSLVLGSFSFAFAAGVTSDVKDEDVKEAVERLAAFGIVNGMDDGKYHPELKVTREQFAKLVVEALGLGSAARAAEGATQFTDVAADRWSSGYINVAAGEGIIKGMGDGTFAPTEEVTYAQAVTMLVRTLGYKDEFLRGPWPGNYVSKAAELDITKDVKFAPSGTADRGSVAVMLDNTLDAKMIKQTAYGDSIYGNKWEETDVTLLEEKLNITIIEEGQITGVAKIDDDLKENEITVKDEDNKETDYEVICDANTTNLLGLEADIYLNDDDEVVYIDVTTDEEDVKVGVITEITKEDDEITEVTVQFADADDDDLELSSKMTLYINNEEVDDATDADTKDGFDEGLYGRFILDEDDEVIFADLYKFNDEAVIVKEINEDKKYVKGLKGTADNHKVDFDAEDGYKLFLDGKEITLEDLQEDDLIYTAEVNELDGDTFIYGFVVRNVIEGKLERIKDDAAKIDGTEYDVDELFGGATYSLESDKEDPEKFNDAEKLEDAAKETVKAVIDIKGELRHIVTDVEESSDTLYGIVVKDGFLSSGDDAVKIWTKEDDDQTYKFDDDYDYKTIKEGDIVSFELTKDGEIDTDEYKVIATLDKDSNKYVGKVQYTIEGFDDDKDYIVADGDKYYIEDDTVIMSLYEDENNDEVDPSVISWENIEDSNVEKADGKTVVIVTDEDKINAEFVVFVENYDLSGDATSAYVKGDPEYDGDDWVVEVELFDGTEKTMKLEKKGLVEEGDFIVFTTNQDGEIEDTVVRAVYDDKVVKTSAVADLSEDYEMAYGKVDKFENDVIKLDKDAYNKGSYKLTDETGVYVLTLEDNKYDKVSREDFSEIEEDSYVRLIINDGDVEMVVVMDEYTPDEDEVDKDVEAVEEAIDALPNPDDITLDDEDDVKAAREAYEELTASQQKEVDSDLVEKLEACEAKIEKLKDVEEDDTKIENAVAKNAAILTSVTGDCASDVDKVEVIYNGKTKEAKIENGTFSYNIVPMIGAGDEVVIKGYVGDELVDTDTITAE